MSELFCAVCSGLMACRGTNNATTCGLQCPYNTGKTSHCIDKLMDCALALIRQQQERIIELEAGQTARVMTLEEVNNAENCMEPVFVEMLRYHGKADITPDVFSWRFVKHITPLTDGDIYVLQNADINSALFEETYNITWRCWTQRPTDEQRKAVPWNE